MAAGRRAFLGYTEFKYASQTSYCFSSTQIFARLDSFCDVSVRRSCNFRAAVTRS